MKKIIFILSIFIPTLMFGQSDTKEDISKVAEEISATWILVKYERDSLIKEWSFEEGKYFVKTFKNKEIVKSQEIDGFYVRIMSFKSSGQGSYEDYFDYKSEMEINENYGIEEVNEIPELILSNGKILIKTIHLYGNDDLTHIVKLNKEELILSKDIGIKWTYKKMR
ncbi:hypothetical protein ACXR6G_01485 [Ancylomarina sp. YFZ004]